MSRTEVGTLLRKFRGHLFQGLCELLVVIIKLKIKNDRADKSAYMYAKNCFRCLMDVNSFNPHDQSLRWILLTTFYSCG